MKKNTTHNIILLSILILALSCKTKKAIVKPPTANPVETSDLKKSAALQSLNEQDLFFNTLSLKAKANLEINGNSNNVTMNIRMQRDEKIWVSITAIAGIEVARALITPDSIKVRNNFQNVYLRKPFSYAYRYTNRQVDFQLLQSVFSGNTIKAFMKSSSILDQDDKGIWTLQGQEGNLAFRVLFNTLMKVSENNLNDVSSGQALKVEYGEYQKINDALFPSSLKINSMAGRQKIHIDLDFSKIECNLPLDFPFTVPKKYEVIN